MAEESEEYMKGYLDGYSAGMIDGEGSIGLYRYKHSLNKSWFTKLGISNDCHESLELLKDVFGGGSISGSNYDMPPNIIRRVLPKLILIVKARHKPLILEALEILKVRTWRREGEERLEEISAELKSLNGKKGNRRR